MLGERTRARSIEAGCLARAHAAGFPAPCPERHDTQVGRGAPPLEIFTLDRSSGVQVFPDFAVLLH
jgi:hypothetical protein